MVKPEQLELEEGSANVTLEDVYKMFFILLRQSQSLKPGSKVSFPLNVFKTLPNKIRVNFLRKDGRLFAWIPEKRKNLNRKKSVLYLPDHITRN